MKLSIIVSLLLLVAPSVTALKGTKNKNFHRALKGDKDGGDKDGGDDDDGDGGLGDLDIGCFSEIATVQVQGKGFVAMKDLQVGDAALTGAGTYSPVYSFGHYLKDTPSEFLQLQTADQTLEMTGEHLVFLSDKVNPVRADSVRVGDTLQGQAAPTKVTKIGSVVRDGLYAPLTVEGSLVVDGIVASSYVSLQQESNEFVQVKGISTGMSQHNYVHLGLSPFRLVCQGVDSSMCDTYDEAGMTRYVRFSVSLNQLADTQNGFVQAFILLTVAMLCGVCVILENTVGATLAPFAVVAGAAAVVAMKATGVSIRTSKAKTV